MDGLIGSLDFSESALQTHPCNENRLKPLSLVSLRSIKHEEKVEVEQARLLGSNPECLLCSI